VTHKNIAAEAVDSKEKTRRRRVRARLKRASEALGRYEVRLRALHGDRSGVAHTFYQGRPPINEWWPVERTLRTIQRDVNAGCPLSIDWSESTAKQRRMIDELREARLEPADADYEGPNLWLGAAKSLGRHKERAVTRRIPSNVVAEYMTALNKREVDRRELRRAERS